MLIKIERKPRPHRTEMLHSPQNLQAAQIVETVTGINECCPDRICFLGQEPCGLQCPKDPLPLSLHLHLQCCLQMFQYLLLRPSCLHCQNLSCPLLFLHLLCLRSQVLLSSPLNRTLPLTLPQGKSFPLYAGLKVCAHLEVTTDHLRLVPSCPHDKFIQGPEEYLPYSQGAHPRPFIQSY